MKINGKDLKEYEAGKWHGKQNYACPQHPHFKTLRAKDLKEHMRGHLKPRKKRAAKPAPAEKTKTASSKKKGA